MYNYLLSTDSVFENPTSACYSLFERMSHKQEDEIMDDVSQPENATMNIPLQEAVYALIANMKNLSHGESSRTTLLPVKDPALSDKKRRLHTATGDVVHFQENEKKKKEDQKPRNEQDPFDLIELYYDADADGEYDEENVRKKQEDHKPRKEQDPFGLMPLSGSDDDSDEENVRKKQEDQKLRMEYTAPYSEKVYFDMEQQIGSLTCSMNTFDLAGYYPDSDNELEFDYAKNVWRTEDDNDDFLGAWKKTEKSLTKDMDFQDEGEPVALKNLTEAQIGFSADAMDALESLNYQDEDEYAKNKQGIGPDDDDDPGISLDLTESWNHLDAEITIFECILDYKRSRNPLSDNNDLADLVKNWLKIDVPVREFNKLMQFLKMKYAKRPRIRPVSGKISKTKVEKVLELAHKIWG